jgi:hypothetical protein
LFSRVLFSVAVWLALPGESLLAHDPHDPIVTVAVSPNFAQDSIVFAATDYLSIKLGVYALFKSTNGGVTWSAVAGLPNAKEMWTIAFSPAYAQDQTIFVAGLGGLYMTTNQGASWTLASNLALQNVALSPNFAADNTLFAITTSMTVFESTNRGQTFTPEFPFWLPVSQHRTPARAAPAHTLTHVNLTRPAWPPEAPSLPVWVSPKHGTASCPKRSIAHLSVPPRFFAKILICPPPSSTPQAPPAPRSAAQCRQTAASSGGSPPTAASSIGRA